MRPGGMWGLIWRGGGRSGVVGGHAGYVGMRVVIAVQVAVVTAPTRIGMDYISLSIRFEVGGAIAFTKGKA